MMTLQNLSDRQQITELIYRYCRSVDRLDIPLGHSIWHEDAFADYGADYYQGPGKGVIDLICGHHRSTLAHSHQITNILIELDGDNAGSESYCMAALKILQNDTPMQMMVWTRYVDHWSRRNGRWGLDRRVAIRDFDEIRPVTPMTQVSAGRRDLTDPSYEALRLKADKL
ncbi:nuclear transport factor 2 family protein [Aestuariicella hydrocarbonica]|uniref:Nuclear transport factor 2 family protein n=1 Tax=Pseudomaricurvus hydrocarbonicus TaxID=1470433 RepID=A0A9E5JS00_9GAMM|nr:nuclear transport factor 2 family protein [Aestuariicella hydrocarbonica]NHO65727.1 nuclear transport factor 2 family protein [Aestuariicella hydrocarbonica]